MVKNAMEGVSIGFILYSNTIGIVIYHVFAGGNPKGLESGEHSYNAQSSTDEIVTKQF